MLAIFIQAQTFGPLCLQPILTYYSVFVTCLKLMSNVFSVYQRTCLISHKSAKVGAIRHSVTGPLEGFSFPFVLLWHLDFTRN